MSIDKGRARKQQKQPTEAVPTAKKERKGRREAKARGRREAGGWLGGPATREAYLTVAGCRDVEIVHTHTQARTRTQRAAAGGVEGAQSRRASFARNTGEAN